MSTDKESSAAGTDNRPPMLVESDYESWKIRIERYIRGKPLGKLIWRSIQNGPTPHPQITVTEGQGDAAVQVTRDKRDEEFTEIENNKELADIQATNILSQGLPRHVFNILNQTRTGKEIWDNVELLMKGSGKSLQQQKEELFDEYERFRAIGNESIHDYFVRFHKLINDMKITQLDIPTHQMNTKFVNNLPPYWAKQIITKTVQRRAPGNVGNTGNRGTQNYWQMTDNVWKKVICYNCHGQGHVSRQCKEKKRVKDSQYLKDKMLLMEAKEKGTVLDAEAEAFLADVEYEGPHAAAAFMANLSSTSGTNGATTSQVNEVHTDANQIFDNVNHLLTHEMHQEEHLDSDVESDIDDNTIPYHQYQLDSEVQDVLTEVSSAPPDEISMITILDDLRTQLDGHLKVYWLPAEELATQKSMTLFICNLSGKEQISTCLQGLNSWIPAFAHVINQRTDPCRYPSGSGEFKPVKAIFTEQIIPFYENVKQLVQKLDENIVTEVTEYMRIFDELDTARMILLIVLASDIGVPPSLIAFAKELDLITIGGTLQSRRTEAEI
ncbi:retrovirus-related pol polyprotein from transposon TNT 1-94 [Tanacetum coccineum]